MHNDKKFRADVLSLTTNPPARSDYFYSDWLGDYHCIQYQAAGGLHTAQAELYRIFRILFKFDFRFGIEHIKSITDTGNDTGAEAFFVDIKLRCVMVAATAFSLLAMR